MAEHPWATFFDGTRPVERSDGQEAVQLPGEVWVSRQLVGDTWAYTGLDGSQAGAAGCAARILVDMAAIGRVCEGALTQEEVGTVDGLMARAAAFYAENAVPPVPATDFLARVDDAAEKRRGRCDAIPDHVMTLVRGLVSSGAVEATFDVPRLPVVNPCF